MGGKEGTSISKFLVHMRKECGIMEKKSMAPQLLPQQLCSEVILEARLTGWESEEMETDINELTLLCGLE